MKTRTRFLPLLLGAALVPVLLAGCAPQPNSNAIGSLSHGKGTSAKPVDGTTPASSTPSASATTTEDKTLLSSDAILKHAALDFPDAKATSKHSREEVLRALYSAKFAFDDMQNSHNFLSGQWAEADYSTNYIAPMSSYLTDKAYAALLNDVAELNSNQQARGDFQLLATYFPESDGHYVVCPGEGTCQVEGYPAYSNLKYGDAKGGGVYMEFDVENRYVSKKDGEAGYIPVTKTVKLSLVPNVDYKAENGNMPYVISGWSGSYERGSFSQ